MAISVTITLTSAGTDTGPNFILFCPTGAVTPNTATKSELLLGKTVTISDDNATQVHVISTGTCNNTLIIDIPQLVPPTTTSTTTTTTTPEPTTTTTTTTTTSTTTTTTTSSGSFTILVNTGNMSDRIDDVQMSGGGYFYVLTGGTPDSSLPIINGENVTGTSGAFTGSIDVTFASYGGTNMLRLYVNATPIYSQSTVGYPDPHTFTINSVSWSSGDTVVIALENN